MAAEIDEKEEDAADAGSSAKGVVGRDPEVAIPGTVGKEEKEEEEESSAAGFFSSNDDFEADEGFVDEVRVRLCAALFLSVFFVSASMPPLQAMIARLTGRGAPDRRGGGRRESRFSRSKVPLMVCVCVLCVCVLVFHCGCVSSFRRVLQGFLLDAPLCIPCHVALVSHVCAYRP